MRGVSQAGIVLALLGAVAAQQPDIASLPARDAHEGLTVAADPYADAARSKGRFGKKHPVGVGLLAIEVFFRNDNDQAIRVELAQMRLVLEPPGRPRQGLEPLPFDEVMELLLAKQPDARRPTIPGRVTSPPRGKDWVKLEELLRPMMLEMDVLPPRSLAHGFVFFNLNRRFDLLPYASLYIPELLFLRDQKPLLFFEVHLAPRRP